MFRDAFRDMGRKENFSYEGLEIIFNDLEEMDAEIELDVIAICCDYRENDYKTIAADYSIDLGESEEENLNLVREYLENETCLIGQTGNSFIYQAF